jgi:hypothetical protein
MVYSREQVNELENVLQPLGCPREVRVRGLWIPSLVSLEILELLLFIIRVKRELKIVYRNGCRYNERLNSEAGGSKTPRTHWVESVVTSRFQGVGRLFFFRPFSFLVPRGRFLVGGAP